MGFVNDLSKDKTVIIPTHPKTRKICEDAKRGFTGNVNIIEPIDYFYIEINYETKEDINDCILLSTLWSSASSKNVEVC